MPEKKKQHFIPQLLMRHFATDANKKLIDLFNADSNFYRQDCGIKSQGQEDNFYGEDKVLEEKLGKLEADSAPVIKGIIDSHTLPNRDTKEYGLLFFFSMLMAYRTKNSAAQLNEAVNKTLQKMLKHDNFSVLKNEEIRFQLANAPAHSLSIVSKRILEAYDLELKLVVNRTNVDFITSDNPVAKYNQFLERREHPGGHLGMFAKGLQMFFPLSPRCLLVYYDKWAYKIGNKLDRIVMCDLLSDVNTLNYLQILACDELVYFNRNTSEHSLQQLSEKAINLRKKDYTKNYEINQNLTDLDGNKRIQYITHSDDRRFKMDLSFIKETKLAKKHNLSDFGAQVRKESMRK